MPTLDDANASALGISSATSSSMSGSAQPEWGEQVQSLLDAAADSRLVRTQTLGKKAAGALDDLKTALEREQKIAEHAAAIARIRRGED